MLQNFRKCNTLCISCYKISKNVTYKIIHVRRINSTATSSLHVAYTQQGNQAGNGCKEMAVGTRIPLPAECQERAGQAGHRDAQRLVDVFMAAQAPNMLDALEK